MHFEHPPARPAVGVVHCVVDAHHKTPAVVVPGVPRQRRPARDVTRFVLLLTGLDVGVREDHRPDRLLNLERPESRLDVLQHGVDGVQGRLPSESSSEVLGEVSWLRE